MLIERIWQLTKINNKTKNNTDKNRFHRHVAVAPLSRPSMWKIRICEFVVFFLYYFVDSNFETSPVIHNIYKNEECNLNVYK